MTVAGIVVPVLYLAWWMDRLEAQPPLAGEALLSLTAVLACVLLWTIAKED